MSQIIPTTCPRDCYDTCGLIVTLDEPGHILSVRGDPEHPMTRGITCPRAAQDHVRLHKNRVQAPYLRHGGQLQQSDWDAALQAVADRLRGTLQEHGPQAVLFLDYAGNTGLLTQAFPQRLWHAIGATFTDHALCSKSGSTALALHYGERYGIFPDELLEAQWIVFWGFNGAVSSPHLWALARQARRSRGARIAVVDPRRSESARGADLWIAPRPGSDVALAYGVIHQLMRHDRVDRQFIEDWTLGFDALQVEASKWPPERAAQVTGVLAQDIERLAEAYAQHRPGATMIGIGLQKSDHGADQVRAVSFIPTVLGQHRGWYYSNGDAWCVDQALVSGQSLAEARPRTVPQVALADMVQAGQFKFIYIHLMNPAITLPGQQAFRDGLSRPDVFVAVHETHWTKTTEYADAVLPALTFLEKDDLVIPWSHGYVQYSPGAVPPLTQGLHEIALMRGLAERLGLEQQWLSASIWQTVQRALRGALEQGTWRDLRSGARLRLRRKPRERYPTPSGKIEFESALAIERGWDPLPLQAPLHQQQGQFILLTSGTSRYTHTQFQEVYGPIPAAVHVHPRDAERLGIRDGQALTLANELGQFQARAVLSEALPVGVLWAPRQSEGLAGQPQNALMNSQPQSIGGGPRFNSTTVTISRT